MYILISVKFPNNIVKSFEVESKQIIFDFIKTINEEYGCFSFEQGRQLNFVKSRFLCKTLNVFDTFENHGIITGDIIEPVVRGI